MFNFYESDNLQWSNIKHKTGLRFRLIKHFLSQVVQYT